MRGVGLMTFERTGIVLIECEGDIVAVRKATREISMTLGFGVTEVTRIVTAASELARNVFHYAETGAMNWSVLDANERLGVELSFADEGPGISDVEEAMEMGFTTRGGLGLGLPGAKRLMDEMEIESQVGRGTTVRVRKWVKK